MSIRFLFFFLNFLRLVIFILFRKEFNMAYVRKPTKYRYDMTPELDWDFICHVQVPKDRWFTDEEFDELFIKAYHLTEENVQKMKDYDKRWGFNDRFKPHKYNWSERDIKKASQSGRTERERELYYALFSGEILKMTLMWYLLNDFLKENADLGRSMKKDNNK